MKLKIQRKFKTRLKKNRRDLIYAEGRSKFGEDLIHEGHEMRNIEGIMTIINTQNNHPKINILEDIQIMRTAESADIERRHQWKVQTPLQTVTTC